MTQVRYTVVHHGPRLDLGLTLVAYCVADVIHRLSSAPGHPLCTLPTEKIGESLGISKKSVINNIGKLIAAGLVEKVPNGRGHAGYRTTEKWFQTVELIAQGRGEQSSPEKKVPPADSPPSGEESSPGKKVHRGKKFSAPVKKVLRPGEESSPPHIRETVRDSKRQKEEEQLTLGGGQATDPYPVVERLRLTGDQRLALRALLSTPASVDVSNNKASKMTDASAMQCELLHLLAALELSTADHVGDGDTALELWAEWRTARKGKVRSEKNPWVSEVNALRRLISRSPAETLEALRQAYAGAWQGFEWHYVKGLARRQDAIAPVLETSRAMTARQPKSKANADWLTWKEPAIGAETWMAVLAAAKESGNPDALATLKFRGLEGTTLSAHAPNSQAAHMVRAAGHLEAAAASHGLSVEVVG